MISKGGVVLPVVTQEIILDVSRHNTIKPVLAKQGDIESRFLHIILVDNGAPLSIPADATVLANVKRVDGSAAAIRCTFSENIIVFPLSKWVLELGNNIRCDISVIHGSVKLTSFAFHISAERATYTDDDILADDNYNILISLLDEHRSLVDETTTALESLQQMTTEAAEVTHRAQDAALLAETQAIAAQNAAIAATQASDTAEQEITKAQQATQDAVNATSQALAASTSALDAAGIANSAAEEASTASANADEKAIAAEAAAINAQLAADNANGALQEMNTKLNELNSGSLKAFGVNATVDEINTLVGITDNIQEQFDSVKQSATIAIHRW